MGIIYNKYCVNTMYIEGESGTLLIFLLKIKLSTSMVRSKNKLIIMRDGIDIRNVQTMSGLLCSGFRLKTCVT